MPNLKTTALEPRQRWRSCMIQRQFRLPYPQYRRIFKPQVINKHTFEHLRNRLRGEHVPWKLVEEDRKLQIALYIRLYFCLVLFGVLDVRSIYSRRILCFYRTREEEKKIGW
ncbi:hypothetical protein VTP01DRAFT_6153 [Rhizomucor pusillus]|uniref:uncharacterized protein n=1 Tax=Rhizomucor pusillus TaxID=4840 RepID=UPI0037436452